MWGLVSRAVLGGRRLGNIVEIDGRSYTREVAGAGWKGQHRFQPAEG